MTAYNLSISGVGGLLRTLVESLSILPSHFIWIIHHDSGHGRYQITAIAEAQGSQDRIVVELAYDAGLMLP